MSTKVAVISVSGGMDSTCLMLHMLAKGYQVVTVSLNYGQKHSVELSKLQQNLRYLESEGFFYPTLQSHFLAIPDLGKILSSSLTSPGIKTPEGHYEEENMKATVVPNRNAIFSSILFGSALSEYTKLKSQEENPEVVLCLGVHAGDHAIYPDCRPEFYEELIKVFQMGNWDGDKIQFELPYLLLNKTDILTDALKSCEKLGLDFDTVLKNTNTSYNPDVFGRASGTSGADIERIEAFINIGRTDPCEYVKPWAEIISDAQKVLSEKI